MKTPLESMVCFLLASLRGGGGVACHIGVMVLFIAGMGFLVIGMFLMGWKPS